MRKNEKKNRGKKGEERISLGFFGSDEVSTGERSHLMVLIKERIKSRSRQGGKKIFNNFTAYCSSRLLSGI